MEAAVGHKMGYRYTAADVAMLNSDLDKMRAEIERLTAALETCRELRKYDAKTIERLRSGDRMEGLR
jgi:hypothetical protein